MAAYLPCDFYHGRVSFPFVKAARFNALYEKFKVRLLTLQCFTPCEEIEIANEVLGIKIGWKRVLRVHFLRNLRKIFKKEDLDFFRFDALKLHMCIVHIEFSTYQFSRELKEEGVESTPVNKCAHTIKNSGSIASGKCFNKIIWQFVLYFHSVIICQ